MAMGEASEMGGRTADSTSSAEAGAESRLTLASAAFAAMPLVRTRPEAAAMTAAWRPMPPALSLTAFAMTAIELVLVTSARCRAVARVVISSLFRFSFATACRQAKGVGRAGILGVRRRIPNGDVVSSEEALGKEIALGA